MRQEKLYLVDIVQASESIGRFLSGVTSEQFLVDDLIRSAVLQKLMVIGEAAGRLSADFKSKHNNIPWADMSGFRNIAVHGYFTMKWDIVWVIAKEEIPALIKQISAILTQGEDTS
ncbi:MAG: DUF86 domain-containing protein [Acidimicrobiia bacterium]|nr:DUF86 domain-containing protein [Acidimicrobiia bacterium]